MEPELTLFTDLHPKDTDITRIARIIFKVPEKTPFFHPWLWLVLNTTFACIFFYKFRRQHLYEYKVLAFIQLSGIIFLLSNFFIYQHDRDFRYNHWCVFVFIIGLIYLLSGSRLRKNLDAG